MFRRIRGALGLGVLWAGAGILLGFAIEFVDNLFLGGAATATVVDIWPALLAVLGFLGGSVFSLVLGVAARRRRFDELSIPFFAFLGAVGGAALGLFAVAMELGSDDPAPFWIRVAALAGIPAVGSAVAAAGTLWIARMGDDRELLDASESVAEVGLSGDEAKELLGDGG